MGDRFELIKNCVYCDAINKEVWYAPTCNSLTFTCEKCGKENFIVFDEGFTVKKLGDVTYDDVYWAINNASSMMDEKQIESCANDKWNNLLMSLREEKEKNEKGI